MRDVTFAEKLLKDEDTYRVTITSTKLRIAAAIFVFAALGGLPGFATGPSASVENMAPGTIDWKLNQPEFRVRLRKLDCSHLVHALYKSFGLNYQYANSYSLYNGVRPFRRVARPEYGDLVVWRGHVGIVTDPSQHRFLSALRRGVRTASYLSNYWKQVGHPRFFRYASREDRQQPARSGYVRHRPTFLESSLRRG